MSLFKCSLALYFSLLLLACNNKPSNPSSDMSSLPSGEQVAESAIEMNGASLDLTQYGIANYEYNALGGLKVGDKAPDFNLPNQDGKAVTLEAALKEGPVLLVFLRAEWCSYCVKHLKEFQDNIEAINAAGEAKVIAISPQKSSYMKKLHEENQFSFPILFDDDHVAMKDYKVFFRVTEEYNNKIKDSKGHRVEFYNGDTNAYMPVPATYLIGQDKIIKYVHYDPDYRKRADLQDVIAQL